MSRNVTSSKMLEDAWKDDPSCKFIIQFFLKQKYNFVEKRMNTTSLFHPIKRTHLSATLGIMSQKKLHITQSLISNKIINPC